MAAVHLTRGNSDGSYVGQSATDKVGFFGVTPAVQPSGSTQAAVTVSTITTAATTTSPWGFATSTQADNLAASTRNAVTLVNQLRADLVTLGIIKGAA